MFSVADTRAKILARGPRTIKAKESEKSKSTSHEDEKSDRKYRSRHRAVVKQTKGGK